MTAAFQKDTKIPALQATALEKNAAIIEQYKDQLLIVKMPKKGGTGLSAAIDHLVEGCVLAANREDLTAFKNQYCY